MGWKKKGCSPAPLVGKGYRPVSAVAPLFRHGEGYSARPPLGLLGWYCASKTPTRVLCEQDPGRGLGAGEEQTSGVVPGRVRVVRGPAGCSRCLRGGARQGGRGLAYHMLFLALAACVSG